MDSLLFFLGEKVKIFDLYLSYASNSREGLKFYSLLTSYTYYINNKVYTSRIVNFSFYAASIDEESINNKINDIRKNQYAYVLPWLPTLSSIAPFYYSKFLLFLLFICGPLVLFFFDIIFL
ncbi:hypothetical protein [Acinetobacter pittii]|uniref:hypothetical protein n=1 Tax=Acinetobacter pittii TaxID=48296 RepID=UPI0011B221BA|nr:hypothetical protein [Acinetobacter pittii]